MDETESISCLSSKNDKKHLSCLSLVLKFDPNSLYSTSCSLCSNGVVKLQYSYSYSVVEMCSSAVLKHSFEVLVEYFYCLQSSGEKSTRYPAVYKEIYMKYL